MDGNVAVKRVTCAVDCGVVMNPNTIEAQVQSAIVYGLTAALYSEITLKDGRVEKSNFDTYRALRINEMPVIEVHHVTSSEAPAALANRDLRRSRPPPPTRSSLQPACAHALPSLSISRRAAFPLVAKLGPAVEPLLDLALAPPVVGV